MNLLQTEHYAVEQLLLRLLLVLAIIVAASRIFGKMARVVGQPKEMGEILAGIALGPSLFGRLAPSAYDALFTSDVKRGLAILSQIGLVFLMILIGAEFPFRRAQRAVPGAVGIAIAGIATPFLLTIAAAPLFVRGIGIPDDRRLPFSLLLATAVSITAIPMMGRILRATGLTQSRVGVTSITAAAIDDVLGWILLGAVVGVHEAGADVSRIALALGGTLVLGAAAVVAGRVLERRLPEARYTDGLPEADLALVLIVAFCLCAATNALGIFSIFGGFIAGVAISFHRPLATALDERLHDVVAVFLLPIFFMSSGLKTDVYGQGGAGLGLLGLLIVIAFAGKLIPCTIAARAAGLPRNEALATGLLMNTRGLMALVVINVGYDLQVFPKPVFFMLVTMAVVTTAVTTPGLRRLLPRVEPL
ncbi:MAG TPA: cation:proton antiporter [Candidatus Polarisedimenticolaceae bacterium]|nr:cation:proton antiporter [Candidatus Polarisedimenticolaceae bacterium]